MSSTRLRENFNKICLQTLEFKFLMCPSTTERWHTVAIVTWVLWQKRMTVQKITSRETATYPWNNKTTFIEWKFGILLWKKMEASDLNCEAEKYRQDFSSIFVFHWYSFVTMWKRDFTVKLIQTGDVTVGLCEPGETDLEGCGDVKRIELWNFCRRVAGLYAKLKSQSWWCVN